MISFDDIPEIYIVKNVTDLVLRQEKGLIK